MLIAGASTVRLQPDAADIGVHAQAPQPYDLVIRNGRIIDGTGSPWYRADVAVRGDTIALIAPVDYRSGGPVIDANGQIVSPGFIDIHNHARETIFQLPSADNYIRQGVTTLIEGPDGGSPVPLGPFLDKLDATQKSINVGIVHRPGIGARGGPRPREQAADAGRARQDARHSSRTAMKAGAFGMSTGLFYVPGAFTPIEEVIELAKVAAKYGGIHISHMRDEAFGVLDSVRETIRIGEEGGLPTQVTHHKIVGPAELRQERRDAEADRRGARARRRRDERSVSVHRIEQRVRRRR